MYFYLKNSSNISNPIYTSPFIFTDGSCHPVSKIGYGASLYLAALPASDVSLQHQIKVRRFEATSSAQLELQTLLWALQGIAVPKLTVFTDSQLIVGLPARRAALEQQDFCNKKGNPLRHAELYRAFYTQIDQQNCTFVRLKGHVKSKAQSNLDKIFRQVDKAARHALRKEIIHHEFNNI